MRINMDDILNASLVKSWEKEPVNEIKASFKKTIQTKQYESEVVEADTVVKVPLGLKGAETMFITVALQAQLDYTVYMGLYFRKLITEVEFNNRKLMLEEQLNAAKAKAESILKKPIDYLLE